MHLIQLVAHNAQRGFENNAQDFYDKGIDDIYLDPVNDSFVMNRVKQTVRAEGLRTRCPGDGNAEFTEGMGMLACFTARGFGCRSWRYAMVVDDGVVTHLEEPDVWNVHLTMILTEIQILTQ